MRSASLLFAFVCAGSASGQVTLPRVTDAEWKSIRDQCAKLLVAVRGTDALPPAAQEKLASLLKEEVKDDDEPLKRLQDLLDPYCLAGVQINPESRVKAERGALAAELERDRPRLVLLKVNNDAGITAPLAVGGDEVRQAGKKDDGRWLEADMMNNPPFSKTLGGIKLEYVVVRLVGREQGKRDATLRFDAGQGTQDLGFRAEVPILFRVGAPKER